MLNLMPFSIRESDEALSSYRGFCLQSTCFSQKRLWTSPRTIFSLLAWISFYVSSRRSRICILIEREAKISLNRPYHDENSTTQAMMSRIFDLRTLIHRIHCVRRLNCVHGYEIEHSESNAYLRSRIGCTVVELGKILS